MIFIALGINAHLRFSSGTNLSFFVLGWGMRMLRFGGIWESAYLSVCPCLVTATPPKPLNGFWWNFTYSNIIPFLTFPKGDSCIFDKKKGRGFTLWVSTQFLQCLLYGIRFKIWRGNALLIVSTINIRHDLFSLFFYILIHDYFKSVHVLHIAYWGSDCTWQFVAVRIP